MFNFSGFSKFMRIFDSNLTEIELRYAFTNPAFEVDFYNEDKCNMTNLS